MPNRVLSDKKEERRMGKWLGLAALLIVGVLVVGSCSAATYGTRTYNNLISKKTSVERSLGEVSNMYQRRFDLIPQLVESTRGYAIHESDVMVGVAEARAKVGQINLSMDQLTPQMLASFQANQGEISSALSRLMVVVEKYPDLKANEQFIRLMDELAGSENRITVSRTRYNESVAEFNVFRDSFPTNLVANYFQFQRYPQFEAQTGADKAPTVNFQDLRRGQ